MRVVSGSSFSAFARAHPLSADGRQLGRVNNFDALRLLAALAVLVSHAFALGGAEQPTVGTQTLGTIGVYVFFGISGFLIAQSWIIEPHLWHYLAKRALRILPALILLLILTVFVLGPAFTTLPLADYFASADTWQYFKNSVMALEHDLPGAFAANEGRPLEVNGVLWTLGPETWAYLALAALGLAGALRRKWAAPLVAALVIVWPHDPTGVIPWPHQIWLLQAFAVGTSLYVLRDHIPWHGGIALILVGAFALAPSEALQLKLAVTAIPYATIWVAYRGPAALRRLTTHGDFSYGIYLYAWPVGQGVVAVAADASPLLVLAVSLPVTFALAIASWHLVEKPALALKKSLPGRSAEPRVEGETSLPTPVAESTPPPDAGPRVDPGPSLPASAPVVASTLSAGAGPNVETGTNLPPVAAGAPPTSADPRVDGESSLPTPSVQSPSPSS